MHQHKASAVKAAVDLRKARVHLVGGGPHLWPCTWCLSLSTIHSSTKSTRLSFLGGCPALFLNRSDRKLGNETLSQDCTRGGEPGACTLGEGVKDTGETALSSDLADRFSKAPLAGRDSGLLLATPTLSAAEVAMPQTPEEPPLHQLSHQLLPRQQRSAQHLSRAIAGCVGCGHASPPGRASFKFLKPDLCPPALQISGAWLAWVGAPQAPSGQPGAQSLYKCLIEGGSRKDRGQERGYVEGDTK